MTNLTPYIFVYGTLKPGGRNYHIAKGVTCTESAYLDGFKLLHFEPEDYPAMVRGEGRVFGVVLTFADIGAALPVLDALEGLHLTPPEYARIVATAHPAGHDVCYDVWTYLYVNASRLAAPGVSAVAGGDWALR